MIYLTSKVKYAIENGRVVVKNSVCMRIDQERI